MCDLRFCCAEAELPNIPEQTGSVSAALRIITEAFSYWECLLAAGGVPLATHSFEAWRDCLFRAAADFWGADSNQASLPAEGRLMRALLYNAIGTRMQDGGLAP